MYLDADKDKKNVIRYSDNNIERIQIFYILIKNK